MTIEFRFILKSHGSALLMLLALAGCGMSQEEKQRVATVTCAEVRETIEMQGAARVRLVNEAREKIAGEPFVRGDNEVKRSVLHGTCELLVLNDPTYDEFTDSLEQEYLKEQEKIRLKKLQSELVIAFYSVGLEIALMRNSNYLPEDYKLEMYAKPLVLGTELTFDEAKQISKIALLRQENNSKIDDESTNSEYASCVDIIIPSVEDIFRTIASKEKYADELTEYLNLDWSACDKLQ